eukprot:CAMPEP_0175911126 /NCGR_PEP_ID=MMETSP0108-20121206/8031_1 /TAXON_ID=195067 ORGANISM="Goniomonas pacifica, Strain CCMP1869" /NCGR_SAMPLE_ID=MMETSP0108 /ASSEMBLY_ACC=CAM_ASM_000204 /LENGTH=346 /DNA_ID=CAMNT_0017233359 /DNA_START=1 /DNA_END=1041 /DNA_ORIENTATION=-
MKLVGVFALLLSLCAVDATGRRAFYILFANQIESDTWPHQVCQNGGQGPQGHECVDMDSYKDGAVILSPQNITRAHLDKVRAATNNATLLAYWAFGLLPLQHTEGCQCCTGHVMGDLPGRNCSTTYPCGSGAFTETLWKVFPESLAATQLFDNGTKQVMCSYPGQAGFVFNDNSSAILANFIGTWVRENGFDGVYLDGYVSPDKAKYSWPSDEKMDWDGDGQPDTPEQVTQQHFAWAPTFVSRLRDIIGTSSIIIANSAGALSDPNLDGLTIEMESCLDSKSCDTAIMGQRAASRGGGSPLSIMWLTHSETMPPAEQCKRVAEMQVKFPFLLGGTDFFDGSHVVCE